MGPDLPPDVAKIASAWDSIPPAIRQAIVGLAMPFTK
jgi:hypothetical protein